MARTVEQMIDQISSELHQALRARKPSKIRDHIREADYILFDLDETLRSEGQLVGFDIMEQECDDYEDDE